MAGCELKPGYFDWLPSPKKWEGDYWANVPGINHWIKKNKKYLDEYDEGRLSNKLQSL